MNGQDRLTSVAVVALSIVGTLAWMTMTLLPFEVLSLASQYGAETVGAGWIVTLELLTVAAVAAAFGRNIDARDKRMLALLGVVIATLASGASIYAASLEWLIACRIMFGAGCGLIAAATNALPALHAAPERVFASMQIAVGIYFGAATYIAGFSSELLGREYVFVVQLGFLVLFGPAALLLPRGIQTTVAKREVVSINRLSGPVVWCITAGGLTWAGLSAIWAFAEQSGLSAGVEASDLATWFAISGFLTPVGGVAAAMLAERAGYISPLLVGFAVLIIVPLAMYSTGAPKPYILGVLLLNFPITFVMSYVFGLLATLDHSGRGPSIGAAAVNFGGAAGPALGATVIANQLAAVGYASAVVLTVAMLLSIAAARHWRGIAKSR